MLYHNSMLGQTAAPGEPRGWSAQAALPRATGWMLIPAQFVIVGGLLLVLGLVQLGEISPAREPLFVLGSAVIAVLTLGTLALRWVRIPRRWKVLVPLLNIVAIGLLHLGAPRLTVALLWIVPIVALAAYFSVRALAGGLTLVLLAQLTGLLLSVTQPGSDTLIDLIVSPIILALVAAATSYSVRRAAAQRQRQAEQSVRLAEALATARAHDDLLAEILDAVAFGVVRLTSSGEVTMMNRTQAEFERARGESDDLFAEDGVTAVTAEDGPRGLAARGERFVDRVFWYGRPEHDRVALSVSAVQLGSANDENGHGDVLLVYRDVTEQLNAIRARDDLLNSVSHELRTPLTSVLGHIELALDDDVSPTARRRLEVAERNGERLLELVSQILEGSRLAPADESERFELTDLSVVAAEAVESQLVVAAEHGIRIEVTQLRSVRVNCDAFRIRQVVDNLLSNAIKYNRRYGSVTVTIEELPDQVALRVIDTGFGISPEELPLVFNQHFRSERVRNSGVHGHGLGLSISREIVRQHQGELEIVSVLGEGSTSSVLLPKPPG